MSLVKNGDFVFPKVVVAVWRIPEGAVALPPPRHFPRTTSHRILPPVTVFYSTHVPVFLLHCLRAGVGRSRDSPGPLCPGCREISGPARSKRIRLGKRFGGPEPVARSIHQRFDSPR